MREGHGLPLSIAVDGANVHDTRLAEPTLDGIVIARPEPSEEAPQHLCLDAGYVGEKTKEVIDQHKYISHIRPRDEEKAHARSTDPTKKPRALWSSNGCILGSTVHAEYWYGSREVHPNL